MFRNRNSLSSVFSASSIFFVGISDELSSMNSRTAAAPSPDLQDVSLFPGSSNGKIASRYPFMWVSDDAVNTVKFAVIQVATLKNADTRLNMNAAVMLDDGKAIAAALGRARSFHCHHLRAFV
jgi:hypothetical protein